MVQIHGLTFCLGMVWIDQNDLTGQPALQQGIGKGCANIPSANDSDPDGFMSIFSHFQFLSSFQ